jgi:IclR family acetate operon transcriptional repressor
MPRTSSSAADDRKTLERYVIPNLRNACRILKLIGGSERPLSAADIARQLKLPVTTTMRIMSTLQLEGYVRKLDGRFVLGPLLIFLGNASLSGTEIRAMALPVLQSLTASTVETSHLAIPCEGRSLIVAVQDSPHPIRAASRPGYLAELYCSSTGKALLAFVHYDRLAEMLEQEPLVKRTPHTLTRLADIKREVEITRKRGYAVDDEEYHVGVRCLAAPVYSSDDKVVAAIGITAAAVRFPREDIERMSEKVLAAAQELSHQMGYHGPAGI